MSEDRRTDWDSDSIARWPYDDFMQEIENATTFGRKLIDGKLYLESDAIIAACRIAAVDVARSVREEASCVGGAEIIEKMTKWVEDE